jgi:hypothetical protein
MEPLQHRCKDKNNGGKPPFIVQLSEKQHDIIA